MFTIFFLENHEFIVKAVGLYDFELNINRQVIMEIGWAAIIPKGSLLIEFFLIMW